MRKLHIILLAAGFGFLVFLICQIGIGQIWRQFTALGWGLVPMVLAEGLAELCHAISWRYCFSGSNRNIPLPRLFQIHLAGYAVSFLTPTTPVAGEVTKATLLAGNRSGAEAVAAVLIDKLSVGLGHLLFVIAGLAVILPVLNLPPAFRLALLLTTTMLAAGMALFLLLQKHGLLAAFIRGLARNRIFPKTLQPYVRRMEQVDQTLKIFYRERPWDLARSVLWHFMGYVVGIFSTWYFLFLVADHPALSTATRVWFLTLWIDLVTFAMPLNLGVLEGSRVFAFRAFGFGALPGMTFSVVTRLAQLVWAGIGLLSHTLLIANPVYRSLSARNRIYKIRQPSMSGQNIRENCLNQPQVDR